MPALRLNWLLLALLMLACSPTGELATPAQTGAAPPRARAPRCEALAVHDEPADAHAGAGLFAMKVIDPQTARAELERAIWSHQDEVQFCYDAALHSEQPPHEGEVELRFLVAATGDTAKVCVAQNHTGSATVGLCLLEAVERWALPPPIGGATVIRHRFQFRSR